MYFNLIPHHVETMFELGEARFLYGHILSLSSQHGYCYATNNYFSKLTGRDARSIRRYLKQLADAKLIVLSHTQTGSRIITPIDTFIGRKIAVKRNQLPENPLDPETEAVLDEIYKSLK